MQQLKAVIAACRPNRGTAQEQASPPEQPASKPTHTQQVLTAAKALDADAANKLTLHSVVGKGGWGTVYQGYWRGLEVAVKTVVFCGGEVSPGALKMPYDRAVAEAAICKSISHCNVVATYHHDIKFIRPLQEAGQWLEVEEVPDHHGVRNDFKLYLIQELCQASLRQARKAKVGLTYPNVICF